MSAAWSDLSAGQSFPAARARAHARAPLPGVTAVGSSVHLLPDFLEHVDTQRVCACGCL